MACSVSHHCIFIVKLLKVSVNNFCHPILCVQFMYKSDLNLVILSIQSNINFSPLPGLKGTVVYMNQD